MAASDLETRTVVLETKVEYVEERLADQVEKLDQLCEGVSSVREHMAKQNGALPRIEANTALAASRINQLEDLLFEHAKEDQKDAVKKAKETAELSTKQKILWIGAAFAVGAIVSKIIALAIPLLF
jgi:hypothetical protein